jgi:hypothetical protein
MNRWNHDEFLDYLCWVYPRFGKSIEHYKNKGATFDAYIGSVIRLSFKEYCLKKKDEMVLEYSWWTTQAEESYAANAEPEYAVFEVEEPINTKIKNHKQILILLLKCYYFLSDDFIERVAPVLNIEKEELIALINKLHRVRKRQEEEVKLLRERINSQYYRCICYESRMKASKEGSCHYEKMKKYLEKGRAKLYSMRKHLSNMRINASNKQVADLLGYPKGTIDSTLFALKERYKTI